MSYFVTIEVADKEVAETFVEDIKETDSICYVNEAGDECEFGVMSAHVTENTA